MLLWNQWSHRVNALFPTRHGHQQKTQALVVQGIVMSGSTVLQRTAETLGSEDVSQATMPRIARRVARFVANPRIDGEAIWEPFLQHMLAFWQGQGRSFVLDGTPCRAAATIVDPGGLVHLRVRPVAWAVMPGQEKWEGGPWRIVAGLLDLVPRCVGRETDGPLVVDRGLAGFALGNVCQDRSRHALVRISGEHPCRRHRRPGRSDWKPVSRLLKQPGEHWDSPATLWQGVVRPNPDQCLLD